MARRARRNLWGWNVPARVLLALVHCAAALALLWSSSAGRGTAVDPTLSVDANSAPAEVLNALPRIGPVLAGRMVAARRERPFASLDDLDARVRGVGPVTAATIRPFLRFPEPSTAPRNAR